MQSAMSLPRSSRNLLPLRTRRKGNRRPKGCPSGQAPLSNPLLQILIFSRLWGKIQKLTAMTLTGYWYLRRTAQPTVPLIQ